MADLTTDETLDDSHGTGEDTEDSEPMALCKAAENLYFSSIGTKAQDNYRNSQVRFALHLFNSKKSSFPVHKDPRQSLVNFLEHKKSRSLV